MAKLVEILAKQLKEWPSERDNGYEVYSITQDYNGVLNGYEAGEVPATSENAGRVWCDGASYLDAGLDVDIDVKASMADDQETAIVTRAEWQAAVDALKPDAQRVSEDYVEANKDRHAKEWNGEGLPPVGVEVEYHDNHDWFKCVVIAYTNGKIVFTRPDYEDLVFVCDDDDMPLRPIRTIEQITAEEREKAIKDLYYTINWNDNVTQWEYVSANRKADYAKAIDAGYRKQEPK